MPTVLAKAVPRMGRAARAADGIRGPADWHPRHTALIRVLRDKQGEILRQSG